MEEEKKNITLVYELPTDKNPEVFGSKYWSAFHDLARNIPCSDCRTEAESFMKFFHDLKNFELGKPVKYKENFIEWINRISKLKQKPLKLK